VIVGRIVPPGKKSYRAAPTFTRPNFPHVSGYFPGWFRFRLLPFGAGALTHFLYQERPEGMDLPDSVSCAPIGRALTTLPAGPEYPDRTAGPAFELYYPVRPGSPWRHAAWTVLHERVAHLRDRCAENRPGLPAIATALPT
jgi:hypothetical protein